MCTPSWAPPLQRLRLYPASTTGWPDKRLGGARCRHRGKKKRAAFLIWSKGLFVQANHEFLCYADKAARAQ